jgi:uncharacterized protein YbjQ (UPF0145 family)
VANFASSVLVNAQTVLATKFNEAELRRKQRPVLNLAVKNSAYCLPDYETLRKAEARTVEVKYLVQRAAGAATAKAALHTGTKADSGTLNLSWSTFVEKFYTSRKQAQNNVIAFERMFQHDLDQAIQNLKDRAETAGLAAVVSNRTQLNLTGATGLAASQGTWDNVNKGITVAAGNASYFAQTIKQAMMFRKYRGRFDVIADLIQNSAFEKVQNQGAGNSSNTGFQFGDLNIAPTIETILGAFTLGSALVMPEGSFGGLVWNDPENRKSKDSGDNNVGTLTTMADPYGSDISFDVSHYSVRRDESASGGHAQDIVDEWEVSLNIGWAIPPISTATDSAIHLFAQA